eukprot:5770416-Prymnesium_polylepis.1
MDGWARALQVAAGAAGVWVLQRLEDSAPRRLRLGATALGATALGATALGAPLGSQLGATLGSAPRVPASGPVGRAIEPPPAAAGTVVAGGGADGGMVAGAAGASDGVASGGAGLGPLLHGNQLRLL